MNWNGVAGQLARKNRLRREHQTNIRTIWTKKARKNRQAPSSGGGGRWFESTHSDQQKRRSFKVLSNPREQVFEQRCESFDSQKVL